MAISQFASCSTILADLPPHSSVTFFRVPAALTMMSLPTSVEPVKAILSTSGLVVSTSPISPPGPVITFTTPGGKPHSSMMRASSMAESGVSEAGFKMIVLPVPSAGPSFHTAIISGKFHGMIDAHTPMGSRIV